MSVQDELNEAAREMYAAAMFERDNEVRKAEQEPDYFAGSVWDNEWNNLQPYCRDMYLRAADRDFQSGDAPSPDLQPLLDTWRWQVAS